MESQEKEHNPMKGTGTRTGGFARVSLIYIATGIRGTLIKNIPGQTMDFAFQPAYAWRHLHYLAVILRLLYS